MADPNTRILALRVLGEHWRAGNVQDIGYEDFENELVSRSGEETDLSELRKFVEDRYNLVSGFVGGEDLVAARIEEKMALRKNFSPRSLWLAIGKASGLGKEEFEEVFERVVRNLEATTLGTEEDVVLAIVVGMRDSGTLGDVSNAFVWGELVKVVREPTLGVETFRSLVFALRDAFGGEEAVLPAILLELEDEGILGVATLEGVHKRLAKSLGREPPFGEEHLRNVVNSFRIHSTDSVAKQGHREGDVVEVGWGPYLTAKGVKLKEEEYEVPAVPEGDDEDEEEEEWRDPWDEGNEPPQREEEDVAPIQGRTWLEEDVEYASKKANVPFSDENVRIAKKAGLDITQVQLVGKKVKRRVTDSEVRFKGREKHEVVRGRDGRLLLRPFSAGPSGARTKVVQGDFLPPPVPFLPAERPRPEGSGGFKYGDYVKYPSREKKTMEGAELRVGDETFDIVTPLGDVVEEIERAGVRDLRAKTPPSNVFVGEEVEVLGPSSKEVFPLGPGGGRYVSFEVLGDGSEGIVVGFDGEDGVEVLSDGRKTWVAVEDLERASFVSRHGKRVRLDPEDVMDQAVTGATRRAVVEETFALVSGLIPGCFGVQRRLPEPVGGRKKESWESYYSSQLRQWLFSEYYPALKAKAPEEEVQARDLRKELGESVGELEDANAIHAKLGAKDPPSILEASLWLELEKIGEEGRKATNMDVFLASFFPFHSSKFPERPEWRKEDSKRRWIAKEFEKIVPTDGEKAAFDAKYLGDLRRLYEKDPPPPKEASPSLGEGLSAKGREVLVDSESFEQKVFVLSGHGETNFAYLQKVFEVLSFLDATSSVGAFSKFFQAKVANELFPVAGLASASFSHVFPELFANFSLSDEGYERALRMLGESLYDSMLEFAERRILGNVLARSRTKERLWRQYLVDLEGKGKRIRTDLVLDGRSHEEYDCERNEGKVRCKAKTERIPLGDAILCASERGLTCFSINDVLHVLASRSRGPSRDPVTGEELDEDFLDRMERRYGDLIDETHGNRVVEFEYDELVELDISSSEEEEEEEELYGGQVVLFLHKAWDPSSKQRQAMALARRAEKEVRVEFLDVEEEGRAVWEDLGRPRVPAFATMEDGEVVHVGQEPKY